MNRRLPSPDKLTMTTTRARPTVRRAALLGWALGLGGAAVLSASSWAEVTPVPPGSTAGQNTAGGAAVPVAPAPKPATTAVNVPPRPAMINNTVKTGATAADLPAVDKFIKDNVARLVVEDTTANEQARTDLIAAAASPNAQQPNNLLYLQQFVTTLAGQLQPVVAKGTLRQRVNAGIVIDRVLENVAAAKAGAPLAPFQPMILSLMQDPCDGVALWGTKAAGVLLNNGNPGGAPNATLLNGIVACAQKHNLAGAITEEAYNALTDPSAPVIAALLQLYSARVAVYAAGNIPEEPVADRLAPSFLVAGTGMWPKLSPQQQTQTMNLITQALTGALNTYSGGAISGDKDKLAQLNALFRETSKAVEVVAARTAKSGLYASAVKATKINDNDPPQSVIPIVKAEIADLNTAFPANGGNNAAGAGTGTGTVGGANGAVAPALAKP